jgi:hypothetical protein
MSFYMTVVSRFSSLGKTYGPGTYRFAAEPSGFAAWQARGVADESSQPEIDAYDAGAVSVDTSETLINDLLGGATTAGDTLKELEDRLVAVIGGATTAGDTLKELEDRLVVKATGAELNTGTDDAKFVTAKAIQDSRLGPIKDVTPKADGTYTPFTITISKGLVTGITEMS